MTTPDFVAQLEADFSWRFGEVHGLKGVIASAGSTAQDTLRKSLVLVLYSHLEGFCIFALRHYAEAVNQAALPCGEAAPAILAGAWEGLFNAVLHGNKKCEHFSRSLPDDTSLHSHWRRRHFIEEIRTLERRTVEIEDDVINAESNLKPLILQRNLFILGLDHTFVAPHSATLNRFLGKRNSIAHGTERRGILEPEYSDYELLAQKICRELIDFLTTAHREQLYRQPTPPPPAS